MTVLIAYGTIEGQTGKIARHVEKLVQEQAIETCLVDTSCQTGHMSFAGVERVILAASVHERRHPKFFEDFLSLHQTDLDRRKTLMLSVSLSAAFPEGQEEAQDYLDEMKMRTELDPDQEMLVAGAVRTKRYDYYATQVLKHVVLRGRNFDPAVQEYEFTDWDALAETIEVFLG